MIQNAILIDICGTLFYSNTTFDFLDYYVTNKSYKHLRKMMTIKIFKYANNIIYRLFNIDCFRILALKQLKGIKEKELLEKADLFYENYLEERKNKQIWRYLDTIENKDNIILVSGTIDPIAKVVAKKMNINTFISSKLQYTNNISTGKLALDALRKKQTLLLEKGVTPPYNCIITDNPGDLPLIKQSHKAIIILYNNKTRWDKATKHSKKIEYINSDQKYEFKR